MPEITLAQAWKSYDKGAAPVVSGLDLSIASGEFMCLLGPSGCGKTTTLRMVAGLENLSAGEIAIDGRMVDAPRNAIFVPAEKRGLGLVFQSYALWPHLTVERNTDFGLRLRRMPRAEREARVEAVLSALGIAAYRGRYPSELSGGQQQRVALARMLAVNPGVLLLDEPLSNLDARLRLEMRSELKRIHEAFDTTILFVTHDQWEAMTLASRIAVMNEGRLQQVGTPAEIYDRPANRFVAEFIGTPPINIVPVGGKDGMAFGQMALASLRRRLRADALPAAVDLRPEALELALSPATVPAGHFAAEAVLHALMPTGGNWIADLRSGEQTLVATSPHKPAFAVGSTLYVHAPVDAMHPFDAAGVRLPLEVDAAPRRFVDHPPAQRLSA